MKRLLRYDKQYVTRSLQKLRLLKGTNRYVRDVTEPYKYYRINSWNDLVVVDEYAFFKGKKYYQSYHVMTGISLLNLVGLDFVTSTEEEALKESCSDDKRER